MTFISQIRHTEVKIQVAIVSSMSFGNNTTDPLFQ